MDRCSYKSHDSANDATDKKTIAPQDVLSALTEIEFDTFRPRLQRELAVYTEVALRKRRNKSEKKNTDNSTNGVREPSSNESRPNPKRLKREDDLHNDQAGIEESKKGILVTGASKGTNDIINGEDVGQHQSDAHEEDDGGHSDEEDEDGFENEEEDEDESEVEDDDQSLYNEDGGRVTNSHVHDDAIRLEGFSGSPGSDSGRTTHIDPCSDLDSDSD